jgi:hypothetical protein
LVNDLFKVIYLSLKIINTKSILFTQTIIIDTYSVMLMDVNDCAFVETIDYIILNSDDDVRIKNAIYYLDAQSKQKRMTIYQLIYELFQKDVIEEKTIQRAESIPR